MKIQKRALSLVLALSMVVTAFSGTAAFAADESSLQEVYVDSGTEGGHYTSLEDAIEHVNEGGTVYLNKDVESDKPVIITKSVIIDGKEHTLSFTGLEDVTSTEDDGLIFKQTDTNINAEVKDLTVDAGLKNPETWVGTYAIHVYNATATLENVTATGGNGGILVNGSDVTLEGTVDVSGNGFGGIEVSKGQGLENDPELNADGAELINTTEACLLPTIWEDGVEGTVTASDDLIKTQVTTKDDNTQAQYYLNKENALFPLPIDAEHSGNILKIGWPDELKIAFNNFTLRAEVSGFESEPTADDWKTFIKEKAKPEDDNENILDLPVTYTLSMEDAEDAEHAGFTLTDEASMKVTMQISKDGNIMTGIRSVSLSGIALDDSDVANRDLGNANVSIITRYATKKYPSGRIATFKGVEIGTLTRKDNTLSKTLTLMEGFTTELSVEVTEDTTPPVEEKTIVRFADSDKTQRCLKGTDVSDIHFPSTLQVSYSDKTSETLKDIKWECKNGFTPDKEGNYVFAPILDGYKVAEGIHIPTFTVSIYSDDIKPVTGIRLATRFHHVGPLNVTQQLRATFTPSNATNKNVTWASSNPGVATIDQNGLMTYVTYGKTTITVTTEDGGYTASCEVTVQSQEDYDKEVEDAQKSVEALPKASDADVNDSDTADAIKDAVSNVQHYGEDVTKKLDAAAVDNLESLLAKLTDDVVTKTVSVDNGNIQDSGKKITEQPSVSGLLLASGISGDETEETPVELEMKQIVPTAENALLAFELNLSVDGEDTHDLAIPVTVTFKIPDSFTYNSSRTYQIQHINEEEDINELLDLTFNGRYASFTTSSFSTFTLVSTPKNSGSDPDSNHHHSSSGSGSTPSVTPSVSTFVSDTTMDFSVNGAYQFKITSTNGAAPSLVAGTPGVFETQLVSTSGSDYYFKLTAIGKPGEQTGIYVNGVKLLVATVGTAASSVKSDTTKPIRVSQGKTYVFKLTADEKPAFVSGNSQVFQAKFVKQSGKDYFYQVTAVGKAGQSAGFYINSDKTPVTVATVA